MIVSYQLYEKLSAKRIVVVIQAALTLVLYLEEFEEMGGKELL